MEIVLADLEQIRATPNFDTKLAFSEIISGLGYIIIFVLIGCIDYFGFFLDINKGNPEIIGSSGRILTLSFLCPFFCLLPIFLLLVIMPLAYLFLGLKLIIESVLVFITKYNWIKSAASTQATIIDKRIRPDFENSEGSYPIKVPELELKYTPTLAITNSGEQTVWASVDGSIYLKYEPRDTVSIYYSVTDPSVFFIAGE
jgi:hypothetical protein